MMLLRLLALLVLWSSPPLNVGICALVPPGDADEQTNTASNRVLGGCDADSISDSIPLENMTANRFHKICPSQVDGELGQPICGDGTNFAFFATKPSASKTNSSKVLIEFVGGGACWDNLTCTTNAGVNTFPKAFNVFSGLTCSQVELLANSRGAEPISMLCARSIGMTDFTEYTAISVPYCTQDVHIGDRTITYEDGLTVHHHGGHNTMGVLRWLFKNFENPSHILLTGCSAGGTVLSVAYDLIYKHYHGSTSAGGVRKKKKKKRTGPRISVIGDSPTYLSPSSFLKDNYDHWNPKTMMTRVLGKNFNKWRYSDEYPTRAWDYTLKQGSKQDQWGLISHTDDPISLFYFRIQSGPIAESLGDGNQTADDYLKNRWYTEFTGS
jgi:hypothetical protein